MNPASDITESPLPETLEDAQELVHRLQKQLSRQTARLDHAAYNERCFRQLAEYIEEVFWLTNPLGDELVYISPAYEHIWGQTCQSLYENPGTRLAWVHDADRQRVLTAFKRDAIKGQFDEIYRLTRPDGQVRWIHDQAFPVFDDHGDVYRLAGFAADITGSVETHDRTRRLCNTLTTNERTSVFTALGTGLAHDLAQPLTAARNFIAQAGQGSPNGHDRRDNHALKRADAEIQRAVATIRHLRDFAREGRPTLSRQPLKPVLDEVHELLDPQLRAVGITYTAPDSDALDHLELPLDAVFAQQILRNLISNAIEAFATDDNAESPTISLGVQEQEDGLVEIAVSDNGSGIADDVELFEPYATTKGTGLGLGLSVSRSLAESHGGSLRVANRGAGAEPTCFVLSLPH